MNNNNFDYYINLSGEIYRQVKSRVTLKLTLDKSSYFIKKYYPLTASEIIKNLISFNISDLSNDAFNEYNAINNLKKLNIKTLNVTGYGFKRNLLGRKTSYVLTESIEPSIQLDELCEHLLKCLSQQDYYKFKQIIIKFIANNTQKMHMAGLNHRDYYICHYLYKTDSKYMQNDSDKLSILSSLALPNFTLSNFTNNLYLIDLHRMQVRKTVPDRYVIKDLSALLFSVKNYKFTLRDYLRFIKYYFSTDNNGLDKIIRSNPAFFEKISSRADNMREKG